jgi:hypothetical protein
MHPHGVKHSPRAKWQGTKNKFVLFIKSWIYFLFFIFYFFCMVPHDVIFNVITQIRH